MSTTPQRITLVCDIAADADPTTVEEAKESILDLASKIPWNVKCRTRVFHADDSSPVLQSDEPDGYGTLIHASHSSD